MAKKPRTPAPPRPVQAPKRRDTPKARRQVDRRVIGGAAAVVVLAIAIVLAVVLTRGGGGNAGASSSPTTINWAALGHLQTGPPPWGNDSANLTDRLLPLGLNQLGTEGQVLHIHQHLDLFVKGKNVTLPAGVGIYDSAYLTELHTHQPDGIIHVESPVQRKFVLGQIFGEWGVKLTPTCVGSFCGKLSWWVNGVKQTGNPAQLILKAHQEIAIVLGKPPAVVPKSYKFPAGL